MFLLNPGLIASLLSTLVEPGEVVPMLSSTWPNKREAHIELANCPTHAFGDGLLLLSNKANNKVHGDDRALGCLQTATFRNVTV